MKPPYPPQMDAPEGEGVLGTSLVWHTVEAANSFLSERPVGSRLSLYRSIHSHTYRVQFTPNNITLDYQYCVLEFLAIILQFDSFSFSRVLNSSVPILCSLEYLVSRIMSVAETLPHLPEEVWDQVFSYLSPADTKNFRSACRQFYEACNCLLLLRDDEFSFNGCGDINAVEALQYFSNSNRKLWNISLSDVVLVKDIFLFKILFNKTLLNLSACTHLWPFWWWFSTCFLLSLGFGSDALPLKHNRL